MSQQSQHLHPHVTVVRTHPHLQDQLLQAIPTRAQVLTEVLTSLFLVQAISRPSPSGGRLICGSATPSPPSWLHYRPTFAAREFLANSKAGKSSHLQPFPIPAGTSGRFPASPIISRSRAFLTRGNGSCSCQAAKSTSMDQNRRSRSGIQTGRLIIKRDFEVSSGL